jgi:DNA invertase Pin-like site-specific DNA recombinase
MKAIILARVSSKEQEEGQSIPAQVRRLTEYVLKRNMQLSEPPFQVSESSSKETRKQFDKILTYVKNSTEPIALVTDTVDRLQRSFRETPQLDELR